MHGSSLEDGDEHVEARVQEIMDEYGDLVTGEEPLVEEFKRAVQDFLERGPGLPDQRRQALLKRMKGWDADYVHFLTKRGWTFGGCE